MQRFKQDVLVVSLTIALILGSAVGTMPETAHRHGSLDDSIITRVLSFFFGIELNSRVSIPPG